MNIDRLKQENPGKLLSMVDAGIREFSAKPFRDANTDTIVADCRISKGLLFHYFGSKKDFYLYCLNRAMERLVTDSEVFGDNFYDVLFNTMKSKLHICHIYPAETSFVNLASRESSQDVTNSIREVIGKYRSQTSASSLEIITLAVSKLQLKEEVRDTAINGLMLYTSAILKQYLTRYQFKPEEFFANSDLIQSEIKSYIDLFLYGIVKEAH